MEFYEEIMSSLSSSCGCDDYCSDSPMDDTGCDDRETCDDWCAADSPDTDDDGDDEDDSDDDND